MNQEKMTLAALGQKRRNLLRAVIGGLFAAGGLSAVLVACGGSDSGSIDEVASNVQGNIAAQADVIFKNGVVHTVEAAQPRAEAVAVKDGKIIYVGNAAGTANLQGSKTEVIDLAGKMLLPGFVDTHNHAYLRAESMFWVTLSTASLDAYKQATQAFLAAHPTANQVRGVGWNLNFILQQAQATGRSPMQLLDDIVGRDIPAVYITNGHHEVWANTKAMQNAGITKDTPNPPGAFIDRNAATGEPTGILREFGAQNMVISKLPQPDFTVEEFKEATLSFQQDLAPQRGVTSVFVPVHYPTDNYLKAIDSLDKSDKLTVRYDLALWADETRGTAQIAEFNERRKLYQGKFYKTNSIKIFGTGASSTFGSVVWDQEVLKQTVAALDKEKFKIYIHDIGPTSTYGLMLDAYEYALQQNGKRDARHTITHVSTEASPLASRFASLGVRADGHPVPKAFFDAGVASTSSSDYPVRDFYPLVRIAAGVKNGVPLNTMIASHTIKGAELMFAEQETGSIAVGKAADLVVLDKDIGSVPAEEIDKAKAVMTMFNGKTVFRDASMGSIAIAGKKVVVQERDDGHAH
jgi:predicted amidohydrolase YtcJ